MFELLVELVPFIVNGNGLSLACHFKVRYNSDRTDFHSLISRLLLGSLTRAGPGGVWTPPSGFSQVGGKRRRGAPPFLAQLFINLFRTLCENFGPRSLKVRSPGHVKWPHLRKTLNVCHSYTEWPITLKLLAVDIRNSIYETYIS